MINGLIKKINNKSAAIGIIGLGYVALPLVVCFIEQKFKVIDTNLDNKADIYFKSITPLNLK